MRLHLHQHCNRDKASAPMFSSCNTYSVCHLTLRRMNANVSKAEADGYVSPP